jgi:hypothetical protein
MRGMRTVLFRSVGQYMFLSLLGVLLVQATSQIATAQSGRGARKSGGSVATSQTGTETTTASSAQKLEAARVALLVTDYSEGNPVSSGEQAVRDGFMDRLKEAEGVAFEVERDVKRKDALLRAKSEKKSYVVWLRVDSEEMNPQRRAKDESRLDDLVVNYVLFAPVTGEVQAEGRVSCRCPIQSGGIGTQQPRKVRTPSKTVGAPTEDRLERTGRETADRVLAAFGIRLASAR